MVLHSGNLLQLAKKQLKLCGNQCKSINGTFAILHSDVHLLEGRCWRIVRYIRENRWTKMHCSFSTKYRVFMGFPDNFPLNQVGK